MPKILTTNALITCPHGGTGTSQPISMPPKGSINGGHVLLDGDQGVIAGCGLLIPCVAYQLTSMRLNSTFVDERHVMLVTDIIVSNTGFPLTVIETHTMNDLTPPAGTEHTPPPDLAA